MDLRFRRPAYFEHRAKRHGIKPLAAAEEYRRLPIDEMVDRLASDLFQQTRQSDDLTIVGLAYASEPRA